MTDMFQRPANDFFAAKDYQGKLVLFENIGQPYKKQTKFDKPGDPSTVIDADVTVIDADGGPKVYARSAVFGAALVGTLSRALPGKPLLGRITQGVANPGQSAPWLLSDYTDQDAQIAGAYLTNRAAGAFAQPAPAAAPAAPATMPQIVPGQGVVQQPIVQQQPAMQQAPAQPAGIDPAAYAAAMAALQGGGLNPVVQTDEPPF